MELWKLQDFILSNNEKLVGIFKNGRVHGQATFYIAKGEIILGEWDKIFFFTQFEYKLFDFIYIYF